MKFFRFKNQCNRVRCMGIVVIFVLIDLYLVEYSQRGSVANLRITKRLRSLWSSGEDVGEVFRSCTHVDAIYSSLQKAKLPVTDMTSLRRFHVSLAKFDFLAQYKSPCIAEKIENGVMNVYSKDSYITRLASQYPKYTEFGERLEKHAHSYPLGHKLHSTDVACSGQYNTRDTYRLRCLPYFMLLGVAKGGTSDIYGRIIKHPLIPEPINKELYWWDQYRFLINASLGDYMDLFDPAFAGIQPNAYGQRSDFRIGEFTSMTFTGNGFWNLDPRNFGLKEPAFITAHDIYSALPNVKLIVILRNPTSRLYSHFQNFSNRKSPAVFHNMVLGSIDWWEKCLATGAPRRYCVYGSPKEMPPVAIKINDRESLNMEKEWWLSSRNYSGEIRNGMYSIYVKDWLQVFPREQMLFLKSEEYNQDIGGSFNNIIFPYLNVPQLSGEQLESLSSKGVSHRGNYKEPMLPETKVLLDKFYKPFNDELAEFLEDDKWLWG